MISPSLWERIRKTLSERPSINEADTKGKIIEPLFADLGWDILGDDLEREVSVVMGSSTNFVDYALRVNGQRRILIEVKPLGTDLDDKKARQALSYAAVERVRWCVLTDGSGYSLFNSEWSSKPEDALFTKFELNPDKPVPKELEYLSKSFVQTGGLDGLARESKFERRLRIHLDSISDQLRAETLARARNLVFAKMREEMPDVTRESVLRALDPVLCIEIAGDAGKRRESPVPKVSERQPIVTSSETQYWMTPVKNEKDEKAEVTIRKLISENGIYAFGEHTPGRKKIRVGDLVCFYVVAKGVAAYATVTGLPERMNHPAVKVPEKYCWVFRVSNPVLFLDSPRPVNVSLRQTLDAFKKNSPVQGWQWFVQSTTRLTRHDFESLTGIST